MCGDFYPVTEPGRLIGMATLAVGVGILGVLTSYLAQFFLDQPTSRIFAFGWMTTLAICPDDGPPRPAMTTEHGTDPLLESIGADDALVPGWLRRLAAIGWRVLATLALGVVLVFAAVQLAVVTAAIIVGMIISATLAPWVHRLRRDRGWGRTKAAGAVTGAGVLILAAAIVLLVLAFVPYVDDVIASVRAGFAALSTWLQSISVPPEAVGTIDDFGSSVQAWITGAIESLIAPIASTVTILLLAGFLTFFLLQDGDKAWTAATSRMDPWRAQALTQRGRIALERVGGYLRGTAIMSATDAVSDALFLTLLGVPLAGPLAVLVFLGGFIPYIGGFITTTIMLLVTISTVGVEEAVILLVLIVIVNIFQGNLLAPMVYGKMVDIHPALVLIALPAGAALFGIIGLFAALPMVAFAMAFTPAIIKALDDGPEVEDHHALVPAWLDRLGQWSWRALVVFAIAGVAISVAVRIPTVIVPVVLAIVLGATLDPVAAALRRRGVGRGLAALTVIGVTALVVIVVTVLTLRSMVSALPEMVDTANAGAEAANVGSVAIDVVAKVGVDAAAAILGLVSDLASLGLVLVLSMLLTFYFLRDGASFWARVVARADDSRRAPLASAGGRAVEILSGYMVGTGIIALFGAITQWFIMVVLGLPLAVPIAVLAFFGGFIPYIGSAITTLLGFLVAVAVGTPTDILIMFVFTIVFNIVQGNFVAPLVYGRTTSLHPAIVLLAIPAGGAVAGILGMFLVVPFLGVVAATWRTILHMFDPDDDTESVTEPAPVASPAPALASEPML